jgi:cell division protein ZapA
MTNTAPRNVSLSIGGRNHVISVAGNEEPHLRMLAQMIDERVSKLSIGQGQTETRMLLIAALMLADELQTMQNAPAPPKQASAKASPAAEKGAPGHEIAPEMLVRVSELADRVEKLAARLEHSGDTP